MGNYAITFVKKKNPKDKQTCTKCKMIKKETVILHEVQLSKEVPYRASFLMSVSLSVVFFYFKNGENHVVRWQA